MSATLPPTADLDRPSDFGEFYQYAEAAPRPASVMPEPEAPAAVPLTPEQQARRSRLRRAVRGIVFGLLAFTALATCVHVVRRAAANSDAQSVTPVTAAPPTTSQAQVQPQPPSPVAQHAEASRPSEADRALSLAREPVATVANLQTWTQLAGQLSAEDRKRIEHDLSRSSVTGPRAAQETARLELALLWKATARRAKAQKVLVSLARTATDPVVKKYAQGALRTA